MALWRFSMSDSRSNLCVLLLAVASRLALLCAALGLLLAAPAWSEARACGVVRVPNWALHVRTDGADCAAARDIARIAHNHNPSYPARINFNTRQFPRFAYRRYLLHGSGEQYLTRLRTKYCTGAAVPYCARIRSNAHHPAD